MTAQSESAPADQAILFFTPEWNGMHPGAWRDAASDDNGAMDLKIIQGLVRRAEEAGFHSVFLADPLGFRMHLTMPNLARTATAVRYEPFTLMSALAMVTERIGLIMTAGITYDYPFHIARRFASLDRLSGGRAGWNIVTSADPAGAKLFGQDELPPHDERYARGDEFVESVFQLWDTWNDDAFPMDKEAGVYFDIGGLNEVDFRGEWLRAAGPLNVPRPIQGRPVIAQAGSSPVGQAFAAKYAETVFTLQPTPDASREFRNRIRAQAAGFGRNPEEVKVLPSLTLVLGASEEEARERKSRFDSLVDPAVGLELLSGFVDHDLTGLALDDRLPDDIPVTTRGSQTIQKFFIDKGRTENLTLGELIAYMLGWGAFVGTPEQAADYIEEWIRTGACDGFNVTFADMPVSMDLFCDTTIPLLQERGVFHRGYEGRTLRDSLGLARPANRFSGDHGGAA